MLPSYGYSKTDFQAKGKGAYRWDDTDGGATFAVRAIIVMVTGSVGFQPAT